MSRLINKTTKATEEEWKEEEEEPQPQFLSVDFTEGFF